MEEAKLKHIQEFAFHMRQHALYMSYRAEDHAAHFGGGMSVIDILATLYCSVMKVKRGNPTWPGRDRFIMSKGHGVIGYYAALIEMGYIPLEEMEKFERSDSCLMGHPIRTPEYGIEFTNGSLGMGVGLGIGTAIAMKKRHKDNQIYVLVGDGECDEGSVWEAAMAAVHYKLDNLCVIVDRNKLQLGGDTEQILSQGDMAEKFKSFGWNTYDVDGHDVEKLYEGFTGRMVNGKPSVFIAHTVKGKGFSFSEDNNAWHHAVITLKQYNAAKQELETAYYGN